MLEFLFEQKPGSSKIQKIFRFLHRFKIWMTKRTSRTPLCQIQRNLQDALYEGNKQVALKSSSHMDDTQYSEEWNLNQRILTLQNAIQAINNENEELENEILRLNNVENELQEQLNQNDQLLQRYLQLKQENQ